MIIKKSKKLNIEGQTLKVNEQASAKILQENDSLNLSSVHDRQERRRGTGGEVIGELMTGI